MALDPPPTRSSPLLPSRPSTPVPTGLLLLAALVVIFVVGSGVFLLTQKTVLVDVDGQMKTVYTHQVLVGDLLAELELSLRPQDAITPGRDMLLENGAVIQVRRARQVFLEADGQLLEPYSVQFSLLTLLAESGITLGAHDILLVDGEAVSDPATAIFDSPPTYLRVIRAVLLTVDDGEQVYTAYTTESTVGEALHTLGMVLYLADEVAPSIETPMTDGLTVTVRRAVPLAVQVDGVTVQTRTRATTVGGSLAEAGIPLVGEDYSVPSPDSPLPADGLIRVVRVTQEVVADRTPIPYQTIYRADDAMELDRLRVMQPGAPGVAERRTRIRFEDGVEVSRVEEPERVAVDPTDEVIAYGTQIVIRALQTPDGPLEYWRVIRMLATSYSPSNAGRAGDGPDAVSGTGLPVVRGIVAVDPEVVPYFTRVYVPDYGPGLAADSGGAINGRRIDLGFSDDDLELWYGWVDVYLLTPVSDPEDILYVLP